MNVDVSPDGRTIAFDLLGDIYTMPIAGGHADPDHLGPRLRHAAALLARRPPDRLHLGPRRRRQYLGDERGRQRRAPDHPRELPPAQRADLEPRRPIYRRAQAFHHPALARHRRDLALPCLAASATACRWSSGPTRASRRSWASRPSPPTARRSSSAATPRPATPSNMPRIRTSEVFAIERYDMATGERSQGRRRPRRRGPADALARRALARLRPPHRRPLAASSSRTCARARSARSMPTSTRICRRPGRSTASIRTWPGRRTATASSSGPAARSGGSIATARAPPKSRSRSATPASSIDPPRPQVEVAPPTVTTRMPRFAERLAGRQPGRVREPRPALHPRRRRRRRAAPADRAGRRLPALPDLVARRQPIAFVSWNDQRLGEIRTVSRRRRRPAHGHPAARPLPPPALLARRRDHRLRGERQPGPDLEPLVGRRPASSACPPPAAPRPGSSPKAPTRSSAPTSDRVFVEVGEEQKHKLISVDLNGGNRRGPRPGRDGHRI